MIIATLLPLVLTFISPALECDVPPPSFSYQTTTGPLNWHNLDPANFLCGNGTNQSPILLNSSSETAPSGSIQLDIPDASDVEFENIGTIVEVEVNGTFASRRFDMEP
ncbi:hypothetical protein PILCRDRAFT_1805 [Piloderma croceum F 1598]|uniref:Uncharacterized protein n=1 Tax=Piloderma croceum (strain F 1598) TaxID=765440 RepID=A0A0C3CLH5_PILCF|nr:hypothetical protein PILCRDRAFT_1805 [Piloderma croceum F 1598]